MTELCKDAKKRHMQCIMGSSKKKQQITVPAWKAEEVISGKTVGERER